jgi:hypothetical protein
MGILYQFRAGILIYMNVVKKLLIVIGILVFTVTLFFTAAVLWIVNNPLTAWQKVESHILPDDMKITWSKMDLNAKHLSGLNFYFDWQVDNLLIHKKKPSLNIPIDSIRIETSVFPRNANKKLIAHTWEIIASQKIELALTSKKNETEENPFQTFKKIVDLVKTVRSQLDIQNLHLQAKYFRLQINDAKPIKATFEISQDQAQVPDKLHFNSSIDVSDTVNIKPEGMFEFNPGDDEKIKASAKISVMSPGLNVTQKLSLDIDHDIAELASNGPIVFNQKKMNIRAHPSARLKLDSAHISLDLNTDISGLSSGAIASIGGLSAKLDMPLSKNKMWSDLPSALNVTVPVKLFLVDAQTKPVLEKECQCQIPEIIDFKISGQIWLSHLISNHLEQRKPVADVKISVNEFNNKLFSIVTSAEIKVDKESDSFFYSPSIDLAAKVTSTRSINRVLDAKRILVPSPLDILDGEVSLQMKGPVRSTNDGFIFPAQAKALLHSPNQIVDVSATSEMFLDSQFRHADIGLKVAVNRLQLELPPLKPTRGNPRILNDRRILVQPPKEKKVSTFKLTLTVDVNTTNPGAITLLSEYFKPHLPLTINVNHSKDNVNTGFINIEPFDIEYVRRKVHVEKMKFDLSKTTDSGLFVEGQLSVKQTQYKVFIDIIGPVNKPNIVLSSEPDLPRSEIINVLLFDRTGENKESGDAKTAGEVDAAVADKAIGLFGIWAFASTPIKGFSYNPSTKTYTAMVELADDLTASIGSKWESTAEVELRKQISRRWMLSAAWTPAEQGDPETTKLVLQWERRF